MAESRQPFEGHPTGDQPSVERAISRESVSLDTFAGPVHVEWDPDAAVTPLGHLAFFAEYLKAGGRFDALVADSPLYYTSPNAPPKRVGLVFGGRHGGSLLVLSGLVAKAK